MVASGAPSRVDGSKHGGAVKLKPTLRARVSRPYRPDLIPAFPLCVGPRTLRERLRGALFLSLRAMPWQTLPDLHLPRMCGSLRGHKDELSGAGRGSCRMRRVRLLDDRVEHHLGSALSAGEDRRWPGST
jgi:hypothetical protein